MDDVFGEMIRGSSRRPPRRVAPLLLVQLMIGGVLRQLQLPHFFTSADWAPDDPCRDRPFKDWYREMMHLNKTWDRVVFPLYLSKVESMTPEEQRQYIDEKLLREVNPCALQVLNECRDKPDPGPCTQFVINLPRCDKADRVCASHIWEQIMLLVECNNVRFTHLATGVVSSELEEHMAVEVPMAVDVSDKAFKSLRRLEQSLSMEQKTQLFQLLQNSNKLEALHHDIRYPITLSGAICEKEREEEEVQTAEWLEAAGGAVGKVLRRFYALPKEDRVWCATDDVMWEVDDCAAEIKKSYRRRQDPGDCTAHFNAATGKCKHSAGKAFDFESCMTGLAAMRDGIECYITRLARDSARDFTTYDDDKMLGGLSTFEDEYNRCVSGGWVRELEAAAEAMERDDVKRRMRDVYLSCKRLDAIAAFGC